MGTPNFIGGSKETIGSLLAQRASGCQHAFICLPYLLIRTLPAITLELFKFDAGNQRKIRTSIQFTIAVGLKPEADSSSFQRVRKVIDVSDTVISSTKPNRWDPFLHKIKLLIGICDAVSEVGQTPELFSVDLNGCYLAPPLCQNGLGCPLRNAEGVPLSFSISSQDYSPAGRHRSSGKRE